MSLSVAYVHLLLEHFAKGNPLIFPLEEGKKLREFQKQILSGLREFAQTEKFLVCTASPKMTSIHRKINNQKIVDLDRPSQMFVTVHVRL